jgi:uncharacterized protein (TIGR00297 family)
LWREVLWPDTIEWIRLPMVVVALAGLIVVGEVLRKMAHFSPEFSRKFVHIAVGAGLLLGPSLFISPVPFLILSVLFALSNGVAIRAGWLKGIHGPKRRSLGTVYFPISLGALTVLLWHHAPEIVVLAMFTFSMGDAAAAIVGESLRRPTAYSLSGDQKSIEGSIAMFAASILSMVGGIWFLMPELLSSWYFVAVLTSMSALLATGWEALSSKGLDNISVPLSHGFVLSVFLIPTVGISIPQLALALALGILIAVAAYYARALSLSGAVATSLLATLVFGVGGWKWAMPIVVFFVFSSALSFYGRSRKADLDTIFEKSSTRDHAQVGANGGIAGALVLLHYVVPSIDWYPAYVGSVAAATADTWGTEVGTLFHGRTITLAGFKEVPRGSNGGVSMAGSIAGIVGAALVSAVAGQWTANWSTVLVGTVGGVTGAAVDSLLGSLLQARFHCAVCGKQTERLEHCGAPTAFTGGLRWLRNDGVNWSCAAAGAGAALALSFV